MRNDNSNNASRSEFFNIALLTAVFTCLALVSRLL
jgi:hypothetical protein